MKDKSETEIWEMFVKVDKADKYLEEQESDVRRLEDRMKKVMALSYASQNDEGEETLDDDGECSIIESWDESNPLEDEWDEYNSEDDEWASFVSPGAWDDNLDEE